MYIWECRNSHKMPLLTEFIKFIRREIEYEYNRLKMRDDNVNKILSERWPLVIEALEIHFE